MSYNTSYPWHQMQVSSELHSIIALLKELPLPIEQEVS